MIDKLIPKDFIDIRNAPVDIHDIEMNIRDFYLSLIFDKKQLVESQLLDARAYLNNAINLTKSLIIPEENHYIKPYMKAYFWMLDNLGRSNKKINKLEEENLMVLNAFQKQEKDILTESPLIRIYANSLHSQMDNLVLFPLKKAYIKFKNYPKEDSEGNKFIKDANLFNYLLFVELKNSSELMGLVSEDRIQLASSSKSKSQEGHDNSGKYSQNDSPPAEPEEVATEDIDEEDSEIGQTAENFFSEDSKRLEDRDKLEKKLFEDDDMEIVEEEE